MVRRYHEPIDVSTGSPGRPGAPAGQPEAFVWRQRLYVVRRVVDHWQERRAWWRETTRESALVGAGAGLDSAPLGLGAARPERERQVWRVEASAGRVRGTGVFDLGIDGATPDGMPRWVLFRSHD